MERIQGNKGAFFEIGAKYFQPIFPWLFGAICVLSAWHFRFIQDDAFISLRYAKHFAEGFGPVWNIGAPPVEGYTGALWVYLLSFIFWLQLDAVLATYVLGVVSYVATLFFTWQIVRFLTHSYQLALFALLLLGTNLSFLFWATGGLETQQTIAVLLLSVYLSVKFSNSTESSLNDLRRLAVWISFSSALSIVSRLDSSIIIFVLGVYILSSLNFGGLKNRNTSSIYLCLLLPGLGLLLPWFLLRYWFYSDIVPNTYYLKYQSDYFRGWAFLVHYLRAYWIFPYIFLFFIYLVFIVRNILLKVRVLWEQILFSAMILFWLFYTIKVGGDFMEYRMLQPALPLFVVLSALFLRQLEPKFLKDTFRFLMPCLMFLSSYAYWEQISNENNLNQSKFLEGYHNLRGWLVDESSDWIGIGKTLGQTLKPPVRIAVTAAGAIPFYSNLPSVDILGLNDRYIARSGQTIAMGFPGHKKMASWDYLIKRKVHIVIGHPQMVLNPVWEGFVRRDKNLYKMLKLLYGDRFFLQDSYTTKDLARFMLGLPYDTKSLPRNVRFLVIPINKKFSLLVLYLRKHRIVDEAIRRNGWKELPMKP